MSFNIKDLCGAVDRVCYEKLYEVEAVSSVSYKDSSERNGPYSPLATML